MQKLTGNFTGVYKIRLVPKSDALLVAFNSMRIYTNPDQRALQSKLFLCSMQASKIVWNIPAILESSQSFFNVILVTFLIIYLNIKITEVSIAPRFQHSQCYYNTKGSFVSYFANDDVSFL